MATMEMVISGFSNRNVTLITEELCRTQFFKSTASELCNNLDKVVES